MAGDGTKINWPTISHKLGPGEAAGLETGARLRRTSGLRPAGALGPNLCFMLG